MARFRRYPRYALTALAAASIVALTGCGGGEGAAQTAGTTPTAGSTATTAGTSTELTATNATGLTISGTPSASVTAGYAYRFAPTASGATSITFAISNKPAWATFDAATGVLSGTPAAADQGDYNSITISANGAGGSVTLPAFRIAVAAPATTGAATLSWTPPTQNVDGTAVTNLGGYVIYYGSSQASLDTRIQLTNPGLTSYTVSNLPSGTHYFGITAYTTAGAESEISAIGSTTIM